MAVDIKGKNATRKLSPLVGESVNRQVDERGKCEQKRKNRNKSEQTQKHDGTSELLSLHKTSNTDHV